MSQVGDYCIFPSLSKWSQQIPGASANDHYIDSVLANWSRKESQAQFGHQYSLGPKPRSGLPRCVRCGRAAAEGAGKFRSRRPRPSSRGPQRGLMTSVAGMAMPQTAQVDFSRGKLALLDASTGFSCPIRVAVIPY